LVEIDSVDEPRFQCRLGTTPRSRDAAEKPLSIAARASRLILPAGGITQPQRTYRGFGGWVPALCLDAARELIDEGRGRQRSSRTVSGQRL